MTKRVRGESLGSKNLKDKKPGKSLKTQDEAENEGKTGNLGKMKREGARGEELA